MGEEIIKIGALEGGQKNSGKLKYFSGRIRLLGPSWVKGTVAYDLCQWLFSCTNSISTKERGIVFKMSPKLKK